VEKLRAALLDIRETNVISEQNLGGGGGANADSTVATYRLYVLRNLHSHTYENEQVHNHHHDIRRCGYQSNTEQNECFVPTGGSLRTSYFLSDSRKY
jgi:hypothetical protein